MEEEEVIERFGLPPREVDLPIIRDELAAQARLEADDEGDTLVMKALCVLLFAAGHVEDSLHIWRAKQASFDAGCSIDVQLLCGAGYAATLKYLRTLEADDAQAAVDYLLECEQAGDLNQVAEVLSAYRRYYGLDG